MQIRDALLNGPLGFGAAPLGNMFRNLSDEEGAATVDAAWKQGTRYFDTAPFYGAGLSETRLGRALAKHKRSDYLLSTKVGRLILDEVETGVRDFGEKSGLFEFGRPNKIVYDYSADGTKRSIDDSLKLVPIHFQERAERGGPCAPSRGSQGRHHCRTARGVRRCRTQLQLFHPAGAVPCLGLPLHPARAADLR